MNLNPASDPRVFFAAERTLLAWVRTGLTIIAIGFVIARFGLFIKLLALQSHPASSAAQTYYSAILGIAFVLTGSLAMLFAAIQFRRFVRTLGAEDLPQPYFGLSAFLLAIIICLLGLVLTIYLICAPISFH